MKFPIVSSHFFLFLMKIAIFRAKLQKNHDFWPKNGIFQIDKMVSDGPKIEKSSFLSFFTENGQNTSL